MCSHGEEEWWWKFWGSSWLTMINTIGCNTEDDDDNIWCPDDIWCRVMKKITSYSRSMYNSVQPSDVHLDVMFGVMVMMMTTTTTMTMTMTMMMTMMMMMTMGRRRRRCWCRCRCWCWCCWFCCWCCCWCCCWSWSWSWWRSWWVRRRAGRGVGESRFSWLRRNTGENHCGDKGGDDDDQDDCNDHGSDNHHDDFDRDRHHPGYEGHS